MTTPLKPWSLKHLKEAMIRDMAMCQNDFERGMCRAICGREIREHAEMFAAVRRLTPGELAIAEEFGYRA